MAIYWREGIPSRESTENPKRITRNFVLTGTNDDIAARAYARGASPLIYDNLFRQDVKLDPSGESIWHVQVPYGARKKEEPGDFKWNFSTMGGTAHITHSKETIGEYVPAGKVIEDYNQSVGVNDAGDVQGVNIVVPAFSWQETHQLFAASIDFSTYALVVYALTGCHNNAAFRCFAAKEVLFLGATGGQSNKDPELVEMTYSFKAEQNAANIAVGNITVTSKKGQEYLWIRHRQEKGIKGKVPRPRQANVERVTDPGDFSLLGIGTT